jgi:hypothetical protein
VTTPARFRLAPDASVAQTDGEAVVLHLHTGRFFRVNASGAPLLAALERAGGASRPDLAGALVATFGIDEARAAADVDAWLERLRGAALIAEIRSDTAS